MSNENNQPDLQKKYDREGKISKIIETTFDLVNKNEFENITMRQIAEESGVSIGTVYLYFPEGKEGIIKNMVSYVRVVLQSNDLNIDKEIPNFDIVLTEWLGRFLAFHKEHRNILLAFEKASLRRPKIFEDVNVAIETESLKDSQRWAQIPEIKKAMKRLNRTKEEMRVQLRQGVRIIDALVHRHVLFSKLYDDDTQFIEVLKRIFVELILN